MALQQRSTGIQPPAGLAGAEERRLNSGDEPGERFQAFVARYPEYLSTTSLDELRATEFSRLDRLGQVYLDYTGGGLYPESTVRRHMELLLTEVLGNPHSSNPSSSAATELMDRCRRRTLEFFNADPEEYTVIFTANASQALKLVGEAYPFSAGGRFLLCFDNHNSVNGIREFERACGATTRYVPVLPPDLRVREETLDRYLDEAEEGGNNLFAYPAQSNFSGVQHPLEWIERARGKGWDVVLDAAAFVPTNRLDLGRWRPDFAVLSFYKMFGYPTGVGALIARHEALQKLRRPWFAGGTISVASVQSDQHFLLPGFEGFEDGTVNYTSLPAVEMGLDFLDSVGIKTIHDRVTCLAGWLIDHLMELRHGNGRPVIRLYGPLETEARGGTVTINVYHASGESIDHLVVEEAANRYAISLRTGCFCNPGAGEMALGLEKEEIDACFNQAHARMSLHEFRQCIDSKSTGAVRISVGMATNFDDVRAFLRFMEGFREE